MSDNSPSEVVLACESIIRQAERENKWLWCRYHDVWFSPQELRDCQAAGDYRWGPSNWTLRDPGEKIAQLEEKAAHIQKEIKLFRARMGKAKMVDKP